VSRNATAPATSGIQKLRFTPLLSPIAQVNLTLKPNPLDLLRELPNEFPPILAFGV